MFILFRVFQFLSSGSAQTETIVYSLKARYITFVVLSHKYTILPMSLKNRVLFESLGNFKKQSKHETFFQPLKGTLTKFMSQIVIYSFNSS